MSQGFFEVKAKANIGSIEFNTLPSGDLVANLSLAATKKYKDNQGQQQEMLQTPLKQHREDMEHILERVDRRQVVAPTQEEALAVDEELDTKKLHILHMHPRSCAQYPLQQRTARERAPTRRPCDTLIAARRLALALMPNPHPCEARAPLFQVLCRPAPLLPRDRRRRRPLLLRRVLRGVRRAAGRGLLGASSDFHHFALIEVSKTKPKTPNSSDPPRGRRRIWPWRLWRHRHQHQLLQP